VVSTDRDAFQLGSDNVALMMTPRGVSDVHVYTPERVEARLGIRPDQVPDFIGLKGDPSDNIPGIPGIGDKTAGQLIAQYGSLEVRSRLNRVDELDEAWPASAREVEGVAVPWREGELSGSGGFAADADRAALATEDEVVVGPRPEKLEGELVAHDAKALRVEAADDTMIAAYLIAPSRASYELDALAAEYGP